jgi:hypothetical protein
MGISTVIADSRYPLATFIHPSLLFLPILTGDLLTRALLSFATHPTTAAAAAEEVSAVCVTLARMGIRILGVYLSPDCKQKTRREKKGKCTHSVA